MSRRDLSQLEALRFSLDAPKRQAELLRGLARSALPSAEGVLALHELALWFAAFPPSEEVHRAALQVLRSFRARADLARYGEALADSGILGTTIHYRLYWPLARWLAERWPTRLSLDWEAGLDGGPLERWLPRLVAPAEWWAVRNGQEPVDRRLQTLAGASTDATFLLGRLNELPGDDRLKEAIHDDLDHPYRLDPGPGGPSRTEGRWPTTRVHLRRRPWAKARPDLRAELTRLPKGPRRLTGRRALQMIDLAKEAMVTRSRDLEVFGYGNPEDVGILEDGEGLSFGVIGFLPERRLPYQGTYGLVTLQNGVPIGYVQLDALLGHVEVSFNTFEAFRGGESARIFARTLAAARALFHAGSFSIEPYQLGDHNDEAIESGAWWFYQKLGFRPVDRRALALMEREERRMGRDPPYRSPPSALKRLARHHLYFALDPRARPLPMRFDRLSALASAWLTQTSRPRAEAEAQAVADLCRQARAMAPKAPLERRAFQIFAPLLLALPGFSRWSTAEKAAAVQVIRRKARDSEANFVQAFDAHPRLGPAFQAVLRGRLGRPAAL